MLTVCLLGERAIRDDAGTPRSRSSRALALLAYLAVRAGSPQSRQHIAGLFWPDSTDEQALTNLRRELHHLRAALDDDSALVATARDLCWQDSPTCRVDVREFAKEDHAARAAEAAGDESAALAHATAAVGWYRGELLPGGYDDWLLDARSALEDRCVALYDRIAQGRARTGDLAGAVDAARHRVRLRPLEEVGYRALMRLQGTLGDRAGAVSTYHQAASVLERELGVEPDRVTRRMLDQLLARTDGPPAPARRAGPGAAALVGRAPELDRLRSTWGVARSGRAGLVLVRGAAGVGKTRLVTELAGAARLNGATVATAQCFGTGGRLALAPVADWLRTPDVQAGVARLDPVWRVEVERLLPPTGKARPAAPAGALIDSWQRYRFFEGLARALVAGGRPTLLVLDNLHWADPETLAFLSFCLALVPDAPLLVAATARDDDDHPLGSWRAQLRTAGVLTEVALAPLEAADTARLAQALSGRPTSADDAALLQATTGGFPLFVVEAVRGAVEAGSSAAGPVTAVLDTRLEQLSPSAREVAGLAAAVGRTFTLDLLAEASSLDLADVVRAVDELWQRRILRETGGGYDFSHDLLRDAAYGKVSPPLRWLLHRRLAEGLELLNGGPDGVLDGVAVQLAEQYARGGRPERAVVFYGRAAGLAAGMFAHDEAVRLHGEALSLLRGLPEGPNRDRQELAVLEALAAPLNARDGYSSPQLRETLERSVTLAESVGRRDSLVTGLVGLWSSLFVQGHTAAAHRTAARALALVDPQSPLSGPAHFGFGGSAVSLGRPAEALEHLQMAAARGGAHPLSVGTRPDVHALGYAAHAHWLLGDPAQARTTADDAVALARTTGSPFVLVVALAYGAITRQLCDDAAALRSTVHELWVLCERHRFAYYREWATILDGWCRGDAAGLDLARQGVAHLTAEGAFARMPYWLSLVADLAARLGQPDGARAALDAAIVGARARDDLWWLPEVLRMRAAYDEPTAAVERLRWAVRLAEEQASVTLRRRAADALAARGVRDEPAGVRDAAAASAASGNDGRTVRS